MLLSQNSEKAEAILPKVAGSMTSIEELVNRMNEMTEKVATIAANTDYFSSQSGNGYHPPEYVPHLLLLCGCFADFHESPVPPVRSRDVPSFLL